MKLLYFAALRSRLGMGEEDIAPPPGVGTVAGLIAWQRRCGPAFAEAFRELQMVRVAVNEEYAGPEQAIGPQDEIAFFPPVTGG